MDAGDELVPMERLGHVVVGAEAEALDLVLDPGKARQDENRRPHLGDAQRAQHIEARHIRQAEIEHDYVVIVELAEVDALLTKVRRIGKNRYWTFLRKLKPIRGRAHLIGAPNDRSWHD